MMAPASGNSLPEPFMAAAKAGNSYTPRPGVVERLDIPVTVTSEIDGTLFAQRGEGEAPQPLSATAIILRDSNGKEVAREVTSFDGFYLFSDIPPGTYTVEADPADLGARNFAAGAQRRIIVGASADVSSGNDLFVARAGMTISQPGSVAQTPGDLLAAVNLGAYRSLSGIDAGWRLLQTVYAEDLGGLRPVAPFDAQPQGADPNYDLLLGPLATAEAEETCTRLRSRGLICSITKLPMTAPPRVPAAPQPALPPPSASPVVGTLAPSASAPAGALPALSATPGARPAPTPAVRAETPPPMQPTQMQPVPIAPVTSQAVPPPAEPVRTATPVTPSLAVVKLGSYRSRTGLDAGWQLMRRLYAEVLEPYELLPPKDADGNDADFDLLIGPLETPAARDMCARLAERNQICTVTSVM